MLPMRCALLIILFSVIDNFTPFGFKAAMEILPAGDAIMSFAKGLERIINIKDAKSDNSLLNLVDDEDFDDKIKKG